MLPTPNGRHDLVKINNLKQWQLGLLGPLRCLPSLKGFLFSYRLAFGVDPPLFGPTQDFHRLLAGLFVGHGCTLAPQDCQGLFAGLRAG